MADFRARYPLNVPGKYYVDGQCTDCDLCRETAPKNITRDACTGVSYVFKQPETPEEVQAVEEGGVAGCPTEAVGKDGDKFDWATTPVYDWNSLYSKEGVSFEIKSPVVPYPRSPYAVKKPWWKFWA